MSIQDKEVVMLLFVALLGCGKKSRLPASSAKSTASVGYYDAGREYGIENSPDCNGNIAPMVNQNITQIADCHNASQKQSECER